MPRTTRLNCELTRLLAESLREAIHHGDGHSTACSKVKNRHVKCNCWNAKAASAIGLYDAHCDKTIT